MLGNLWAPLLAITLLCLPSCAQDPSNPSPSRLVVNAPSHVLPPINTTGAKWNNFLRETAGPLTLGAGVFNATFSQATNTDPKYGTNATAFAQRLGASLADIGTQNFFGDFVVASVFHEDPRYHRIGPGRSLLYRIGYAVSRAVVIRKDTGMGNTFNLDNVVGSAMSTGFSNIYYPPASRTLQANLSHYWIDVADNGFVNLAPEFWPDFRDKFFRRHHRAADSANAK